MKRKKTIVIILCAALIVTLLPVSAHLFGQKVADDFEVNAATKIKISFKANGGTVSKSSKKVLPGKKLGTLPKAKRASYKFLGWYNKKTGGKKYTASAKAGKKNIKLYAHWISNSDYKIQKLYKAKTSDIEVTGTGKVTRILSDDTSGDRHQRFIIKLNSGQTLLIAHNIDIAPKVSPLKVDDKVKFKGEYVYNKEGGLIHWTHKDPDGTHEAGYIKLGGKTFQ
jgi:uncharacterized repeat protein (TIGR02543 family)